MSKLLVTGGAGFIGANFIHFWLKHHPEDEIINYDKLTYAGNLASLKDVKDKQNYKFVQGDIQDQEKVNQAMEGIDIVVNFAAETHVDRSIMGPAVFVMTNVVGTQVLLAAAKKHQVKHFHHISTDEVFGSLDLDSENEFDEQTQFQPNSPYSASKAASDHLVRAWNKTYGLKTTITNTSNNYGSYQFPEKFIPVVITNLIEGKDIPIYGDGKNVRDWVYVEDHCRAIEKVLEKGENGETYCIGGMTEDVDNLAVAKKICSIMGEGEDKIKFIKDRPGHDRRYAVDWSKAKEELGYEPKYSFDQWLKSTVEWYQENQWWWKPLKEGQKDYYKKWYQKELKKE
jgi:dTDP-glucose 4,6-dehydratase